MAHAIRQAKTHLWAVRIGMNYLSSPSHPVKSLLLSLAASLWAGAAPVLAQYQPGVYASSQDYAQNSPWQPGTVSSPAAARPYIEVVHASTFAVHRVPLTHAWGYTNAQGQAFRLVDNKAYHIQPQQDGLVVYSRQRTIQNGRSTHIITEHFYSEGFDGELRPLTKRALRQQLLTAN